MRKFYLILLLTVSFIAVYAQKRSEADALSIANRFLNERSRNVIAMNPVQPERVYVQFESGTVKRSKAQMDESPAFYIYNKKDEAFVIVSGDERMPEVLAYSDNNAFGDENLPDNVRAWLAYYENAYNALEKGLLSNEVLHVSESGMAETVSPLLGNINFNQDAPYYNMCPEYNGQRCVTGCVATAIASIMKYHEYPVKGIGSHSYSTRSYNINCSFDFGNTVFDWDNMLDTYNNRESEKQKNAVATLMNACGVAMDMDYTPSASGAYSGILPERISKYFGYNPNMIYIERDYYQTDEWVSLLKNELNQNRPVYYDGSSNSVGHAFVLDGYDKDGLFHVNWGWGGYYNGYFELLTLAPEGSGIGGGTDLDGFRFGQGMVLYFQPDETEPVSYYLSADCIEYNKENVKKGETFNISISSMWNMHKSLTYQIGFLLEKDSDIKVLDLVQVELGYGYGYNDYTRTVSIPNNCADGIYKLYCATKSNGDTEWEKVKFMAWEAEELYVEVKGSDCRIFKNQDLMPDLSVSLVQNGSLNFGGKGDFTATIQNNGGREFYGELSLMLASEDMSGVVCIFSKEMYSIGALSTQEVNFNFDLKINEENGSVSDIPAGNYNLVLAKSGNGVIYLVDEPLAITISGESKIELVESFLESSKVVAGDDVVFHATVKAVDGDFDGFYVGFLLDEGQSQIGNTPIYRISLNEDETRDVTVSYNTSDLAPGSYILALGASKEELQGYYLLSGYYFTVLDESETDVKVSLVDLKSSYVRGEDATLTANFETIGNGTYSNSVWAAICNVNEEGYLNPLISTAEQTLEIGAGETRQLSFTLSTSELNVGEYHYIVVLGNTVYLDTKIEVFEYKHELDFSGLGFTELGVKAGENVGLTGTLKNIGKGDFNGFCKLAIVSDKVWTENTVNVSVPASGEYDLSQLNLNTVDIPSGTYSFTVEFYDSEGSIFTAYEYVTVAAGGDAEAFVLNGSLDRNIYSEGDKILFNGQAKAVGTGNYNGYYAAYIYNMDNEIVKNSNAKPIEIAEGQTADMSLNLSTFDMAPGMYAYVIYLTNKDFYFVGKKEFYIEIKEGSPVYIIMSDANLSATEASLGDELTFTVKMKNDGTGTFDGYCAGSFVVDNSILKDFGRSNVVIEGGETRDLVIPVAINDIEPGVYTFTFLVAHSLDEQYYGYYVCDVTIKDGEVSVGEIKEMKEPVVCSAPYEDDIRLISGVRIERISVYDYAGVTVYSSDYNGVAGEISIPGSNIRGGVYLIEVIGTDNSRYVLKAVRD